jgi:hypothetical protein
MEALRKKQSSDIGHQSLKVWESVVFSPEQEGSSEKVRRSPGGY